MSFGIAARYALGRFAANLRPKSRAAAPSPARDTQPGVSVVIPSRNGRELLQAQLPGLARELRNLHSEIIVVDNGSNDGTAGWLRAAYPHTEIVVSAAPLSFSRAVNRGIERARFSHVCLLNNDMLLDPGFFAPLAEAFRSVPDLFCATAQIRFPEGVRREETGKAVMAHDRPEDFPIRCDEPLPGEDLTYVLYGSGGCSVYDAEKLRALGCMDEIYDPAYVEDLDIGYRGWQRGWPSVFVSGAAVEHRHRATTSRYYTPQELDTILEINYLKFLARDIADGALFRRLWKEALERLQLGAAANPAQRRALAAASEIALHGGPAETPVIPEESFLALTDGSVAVFPGHPPTGMDRTIVAAPEIGKRPRLPIPDRDQVLIALTGRLETPPPELLAVCTEIVLVRRQHTQAFHAALCQSIRKWAPAEACLESRDLARYMPDGIPAKVVLSK